MKAAPKLSLLYLLACFSFLLAACSGVKQTPGGGGSATHTISATVSGLSGTGLVLQDNGADDMTISANGTVTFATAVANNGAYAVTVKTQPSTPSQTCVIVGGSGAVAANVIGPRELLDWHLHPRRPGNRLDRYWTRLAEQRRRQSHRHVHDASTSNGNGLLNDLWRYLPFPN
jgi:hypothetical protein